MNFIRISKEYPHSDYHGQIGILVEPGDNEKTAIVSIPGIGERLFIPMEYLEDLSTNDVLVLLIAAFNRR
jgi:hypothetical protein